MGNWFRRASPPDVQPAAVVPVPQPNIHPPPVAPVAAVPPANVGTCGMMGPLYPGGPSIQMEWRADQEQPRLQMLVPPGGELPVMAHRRLGMALEQIRAQLGEKDALAEGESDGCTICFERCKSVALVRCGHRFCLTCVEQNYVHSHEDSNRRLVACPTCRAVAIDVIRTFI